MKKRQISQKNRILNKASSVTLCLDDIINDEKYIIKKKRKEIINNRCKKRGCILVHTKQGIALDISMCSYKSN